MAYPAVMMVVATGVTIFLLTYILPKFTPCSSRKGTHLPKPTLMMMALSDAMLHYWYFWLPAPWPPWSDFSTGGAHRSAGRSSTG